MPAPYSLSFEDVSPGSSLASYESQYGLVAYAGWSVAEHEQSGWPVPQSGANVAVWDEDLLYSAGFAFGRDPLDYPDTPFLPYTARFVSAYVSTKLGGLLQMTGYSRGGVAVAAAYVGAPGESWVNRYVQISSAYGDIAYVKFLGVNAPEEKRHFCIDDLTVVPVPEPSSPAALSLGPLAAGAGVRRRRRAM